MGEFDTFDFSFASLADGLGWDVLYTPTSVQLAVVEILPGDYNDDGVGRRR